MTTIRTTRRLLAAYIDKEPRKGAFDEAQSCLNIEEKLAWGVPLFRGLLDLEVRIQSHPSRRPEAETALFLEMMPVLYGCWLDASEAYLEKAKGFARSGYEVGGLEAFEATVEEARCLCENLDLEDEIPPIEALSRLAKPENPRPARYGA